PVTPVLLVAGLITSGQIPSGPIGSSGGPRKVFGVLDSMGSTKVHSSSVNDNQAVATPNQDDDYSLRGTSQSQSFGL
ncbi:hypothetical protein U1Q18_047191, partial [Sarracenia purpurea var. burkii]